MRTITKYPFYEVHFLKLGDADSIIIAYKKSIETDLILVLVDAGNVSDSDKIKKEIWDNWQRRYIDFAVLTHPDKDHKGRFFGLLQSKDFMIKEFWMFCPWKRHVGALPPNSTPIETPTIKDCFKVYNHPTDEMLNLIQLLSDKKIPIKDAYNGIGSTIIPITIVGPSLEFADRNASIMVSDFKEISDDSKFEAYVDNAEMTDEDAKSIIDTEDDDTSATNMSSLILLFNPGRKFLLAGDASRASLMSILSGQTNTLAGAVLKVPHHGSKHNLNTEIIEKLAPQQSAICASGSTRHPNNSIVYWLSKYGNVYLTEKGAFYYTSEPSGNTTERKN
ncbi:MAG: ComEC/Rec2 family competence protein [Paludibacteraceae bacterium]